MYDKATSRREITGKLTKNQTNFDYHQVIVGRTEQYTSSKNWKLHHLSVKNKQVKVVIWFLQESYPLEALVQKIFRPWDYFINRPNQWGIQDYRELAPSPSQSCTIIYTEPES